jgi:GPH family glycoside/pentoside/hexuronide:cation symporter
MTHERLGFGRRFAYACGSPGFQVSDRIVVAILFYYYLPPGESDLVAQVPTRVLFGGLTAFGVAMFVGRIFDSVADPFVGHLSDRSRSRFGRRRAFLMAGIVPMCLLPVAAFFPPGEPGSVLNWIWLGTVLSTYFVFFTVYVAPYLALLPEIARSERERIRLATLSGMLTMPTVGAFGFLWTAGVEWGVDQGLSTEEALRWLVTLASLVGLALCALPILAVDERRFGASRAADLSLREAMRETLANRPFLIYLGAQLLFIFGLNLLQPAIPYVAQVLLGRPIGYAAQLGAGLFAGILVGFVIIQPLSRRLGAKGSMLVCVTLFALGLGMLGLIRPDGPGGEHDAGNLLAAYLGLALAGIPVTGFVVLPAVLISQIIDADEARTGANRSAMYFGMQGLMTKWMYGASTAVLAYLLARFGSSQAEPLGVWLAAPVAAGACLLSVGVYALYPEREVLRSARRDDDEAGSAARAAD